MVGIPLALQHRVKKWYRKHYSEFTLEDGMTALSEGFYLVCSNGKVKSMEREK